MPRFSERQGIKPVKSALQIGTIDDELRNCLWNELSLGYWREVACELRPLSDFPDLELLFIKLVNTHFKQSLDSMPWRTDSFISVIRAYFFKWPWFEVYDFIEFIANNYPNDSQNKDFIVACNAVLKRELSGYRFVGGRVTQITSEAEVEEIEAALALPFPLKPVSTHIQTSLDLLSDRKAPDYRNSIKESISAVESLCGLIAGGSKATLGQALKTIEKQVDLHPALSKAFSSLYGYTNDAGGIRHALMDKTDLDFEDAKFMLASCSAFINYLVEKASKAGIEF